MTAHLGSVKTHIKEGNDCLLLALGSLDTGIHESNDLFREIGERSEKHSLRLDESIRAGFTSFNATLIEALKIQSYSLQKVLVENMQPNDNVTQTSSVPSRTVMNSNDESRHDSPVKVLDVKTEVGDHHVSTTNDSTEESELDTNQHNIMSDYYHDCEEQPHSLPEVPFQQKDNDPLYSKSEFQPSRVNSNRRHENPRFRRTPLNHGSSHFGNKPSHDSNHKNMFGMNSMSLVANDKIKFNDIINYMEKVSLASDTAKAMEKFYDGITLAVNVGFQFNVTFLPSFEELDSEIDFEDIFLGDIRGTTSYTSVRQIYKRLSDIIKKRFESPDCFSKSKCPLAYRIIESHSDEDGWELLCTLLTQRLIKCGARSTVDLDSVRSTLIYKQNESYHDFYQ